VSSPRKSTSTAARVGAVVLAAGGSSRMKGTNKLLEPLDGEPVVAHVVGAAAAGGASPIVVVTGHHADAVRDALRGADVELVGNPRWQEGLSTSLAAGVAALEGRVGGALICLGDMPRVSPEDVAALVRAFGEARRGSVTGEPPAAIVPVHGGEQGNPVLWSAEWFPRLRTISGDRGAKSLLAEVGERVLKVGAGRGVLLDADTPEALERIRSERPKTGEQS
jgi:molybdenum cofactor cytidylyltransferase